MADEKMSKEELIRLFEIGKIDNGYEYVNRMLFRFHVPDSYISISYSVYLREVAHLCISSIDPS